jgi:hypothetical protein
MPYFSKNLPPKMRVTGFNKLSITKARQIRTLRKNQQRLPFTIKKSNIEGAGRGTFTNVKLPPSTMIMLYIGTQQSAF